MDSAWNEAWRDTTAVTRTRTTDAPEPDDEAVREALQLLADDSEKTVRELADEIADQAPPCDEMP